jgi:hypothetical protein
MEYFYRIKAVNAAGNSAYSNEVSAEDHVTWLGHSSNWNDRWNWNHGYIPDQYCDVKIPAAPVGGIFPVLNSGNYGQIRKLTVEDGAVFTIPSGKSLEINGQ